MNIRSLIIVILLLSGVTSATASILPSDRLIIVSGTVREKTHKKKLAGVNLSVRGRNIATVTNSEGAFTLKIPRSRIGAGILAEHIGYGTALLDGKRLYNGASMLTIWLTPATKTLDELTVYGADAKSLVKEAIGKIPQNYSSSPNMFSSFYRETIQKGKRYVGISEAIIDVLKRPYRTRTIAGDRVRIAKGRRLMSQRKNDTIAVKIMGGPTLPVALDIVKNEDFLLNESDLDLYEFKMEPMDIIDDRPQFVVGFKPFAKTDYAMYNGKIYIDLETLSITRAEFSLDVSDREKATRAILYKKPRGLHFKPQEMAFTVTYKIQDGITYLNYIKVKTRFKCDWKRRLFSSGFTALAEMVMVDRDNSPLQDISRKEAFGRREIFSDKVDDFSDREFWKDYNIIEPTESLENAVLKLSRR